MIKAWTPFFLDRTTKDGAEIWGNSHYTVIKRYGGDGGAFGPMVWLSIHDHERSAAHDWRDLQRIKNELVGDEAEAIEIYPPESHIVDMANEWHLWCFTDPDAVTPTKLGVGFRQGRNLVEKPTLEGSKQRAWDADTRPGDLIDPTSLEFTARLKKVMDEFGEGDTT